MRTLPFDRPSRCLLELRFALAARRFALRSLASALRLIDRKQRAGLRQWRVDVSAASVTSVE